MCNPFSCQNSTLIVNRTFDNIRLLIDRRLTMLSKMFLLVSSSFLSRIQQKKVQGQTNLGFVLLIECSHSRGQHPCKFIEIKESVCIRKGFNSHRTGLGHQHDPRFIVLGHQYGRRDVMWKHSIWLSVYFVAGKTIFRCFTKTKTLEN